VVLNLSITSPEKEIFKGNALAVVVPALGGQLTILPGHIPLITPLEAGEVIIKVNEAKGIYDGEQIFLAISGGFLEVQAKSRVNLLVDTAQKLEEIDREQAEMARKKAEELLLEHKTEKEQRTQINVADVEASLAQAVAALKVVRKRKRES